ncbi:hypothetical protein [Sodalis glossinidius]|nr:hypothetical protein [Sodalis glossinidius]
MDSLSTADGPVSTYLDLLLTTVDTIASGFGQAPPRRYTRAPTWR